MSSYSVAIIIVFWGRSVFALRGPVVRLCDVYSMYAWPSCVPPPLMRQFFDWDGWMGLCLRMFRDSRCLSLKTVDLYRCKYKYNTSNYTHTETKAKEQ